MVACSDGFLNERWFVSLSHTKTMIEVWWQERPKKVLSGFTPSDYARQLAGKSVTVNPDSKPLCYRKARGRRPL